jgi:hypothetical protein
MAVPPDDLAQADTNAITLRRSHDVVVTLLDRGG